LTLTCTGVIPQFVVVVRETTDPDKQSLLLFSESSHQK
jgi:hypothetical protein